MKTKFAASLFSKTKPANQQQATSLQETSPVSSTIRVSINNSDNNNNFIIPIIEKSATSPSKTSKSSSLTLEPPLLLTSLSTEQLLVENSKSPESFLPKYRQQDNFLKTTHGNHQPFEFDLENLNHSKEEKEDQDLSLPPPPPPPYQFESSSLLRNSEEFDIHSSNRIQQVASVVADRNSNNNTTGCYYLYYQYHHHPREENIHHHHHHPYIHQYNIEQLPADNSALNSVIYTTPTTTSSSLPHQYHHHHLINNNHQFVVLSPSSNSNSTVNFHSPDQTLNQANNQQRLRSHSLPTPLPRVQKQQQPIIVKTFQLTSTLDERNINSQQEKQLLPQIMTTNSNLTVIQNYDTSSSVSPLSPMPLLSDSGNVGDYKEQFIALVKEGSAELLVSEKECFEILGTCPKSNTKAAYWYGKYGGPFTWKYVGVPIDDLDLVCRMHDQRLPLKFVKKLVNLIRKHYGDKQLSKDALGYIKKIDGLGFRIIEPIYMTFFGCF